jgi:hypothetical protein
LASFKQRSDLPTAVGPTTRIKYLGSVGITQFLKLKSQEVWNEKQKYLDHRG